MRDRKQWERYRAVLGKESTPSFSGFRAMKKAGSLSYERLRWDYRFENAYRIDKDHPTLSKATAPKGVLKKLTTYSLNTSHETGKHKAIVFESALGYNLSNAEALQQQIESGILKYRAIPKGDEGHGSKFDVIMLVDGPSGKQPITTGWIYDPSESEPRMVTAYVHKKLKRP